MSINQFGNKKRRHEESNKNSILTFKSKGNYIMPKKKLAYIFLQTLEDFMLPKNYNFHLISLAAIFPTFSVFFGYLCVRSDGNWVIGH